MVFIDYFFSYFNVVEIFPVSIVRTLPPPTASDVIQFKSGVNFISKTVCRQQYTVSRYPSFLLGR